jgi:hypothetical protein
VTFSLKNYLAHLPRSRTSPGRPHNVARPITGCIAHHHQNAGPPKSKPPLTVKTGANMHHELHLRTAIICLSYLYSTLSSDNSRNLRKAFSMQCKPMPQFVQFWEKK